MIGDENKVITYLSNAETDKISRALLSWLNQFPNKPVTVINYEYLDADNIGMALSTIQGAYKIRQYITGGYQAQYQFKIIYRLQPITNNDRLSADELLNELADWAAYREEKPSLGIGRRNIKITCNARSSLFAAYDDGSEDHQILMTMNYEVL